MLAEGSLINGDDELAIVHAHAEIVFYVTVVLSGKLTVHCMAWSA